MEFRSIAKHTPWHEERQTNRYGEEGQRDVIDRHGS